MGRCLSLTIFLVSLRLALRSDVQITPHLKSAFSCRSSEASTNTNLIDEAVSTLGKAAFVDITCQPSLYGISAKMTLASMSLSHILYAVNLWANVCESRLSVHFGPSCFLCMLALMYLNQ